MKGKWPTLALHQRLSSISWTWGMSAFVLKMLSLMMYRYEPANRQTTPDFLVTVTDPKGRIPRVGAVGQPRTADEFAAYFKSSKAGQNNKLEMDEYESEHVGSNEKKSDFVESARAELAKHTSKSRFVSGRFCGILVLTGF